MRKTSKIVSLLLTLVMILGIAVPMTVSADTLSFTDVPASHQYHEAIMNLVAEGIVNGMGDGTYQPEGSVTRAQFAKIICYATGVGELKYSAAEKSIFADVAPEHWASDNIKTAYDSKIINGMGDGTFAPENPVLYEQAVKMVVCALGHTTLEADRQGGYPTGYLVIANKANLLTGLKDVKQGEPLNRGAVAKIIDNMRDAQQVVDGKESGSLRDQTQGTTKKAEGRVIGLYGNSLYAGEDASTCNKNQLELEIGSKREIFDATEVSIAVDDFLGRSVIIYYDDDSSYDYKLIKNITYQAGKNTKTEIDMNLIRNYDVDYIEYYDSISSAKANKIRFASDSQTVFNGQSSKDSLKTLIDNNKGKSGSITLVASSGGDTADVAFVKAYKTVIVSSIDTTNYKVKCTNGDEYILDVKDRSKNVSILSSGKNIEISKIKKDNILSIAESDDKKYIEVLVSSSTSSGMVKLSDGESIVLDVSSSPTYYFNEILTSKEKDLLGVGSYVKVYLDAFGKIAYVTASSQGTYLYGYMSLIQKPQNRDDKFWVKLHTEKDIKGQSYELAEKVKVTYYNSGEGKCVTDTINSIDNANKLANIFIEAASDVNDVVNDEEIYYGQNEGFSLASQPVRYILSGSVVQSIVTNIDYASLNTPTVELGIKEYTGTPIKCTVDKKKLDNYNISSSTKFFFIPADRVNGTYTKWTVNNFKKDTEYYAHIANFSTGTIGAVYIYGTSDGNSGSVSVIDNDCKPMVVTESMLKASPKDKTEEVWRLILKDIVTGQDITVYDNESGDVDAMKGLKAGDIVRIAYEYDAEYSVNYASKIQVMAVASEIVDGTTLSTAEVYEDDPAKGEGAEFRTVIASLKNWSGDKADALHIVLGTDVDSEVKNVEYHTITNSTKLYAVNTNVEEDDPERVIVATESELAPGTSKLFIFTESLNVKAIVIFR